MTEQLTRLFWLPIAMVGFLYAAQMSAGLIPRDAPVIQLALR